MRSLKKWAVVGVIVIGAGAAALPLLHRPARYRYGDVVRGDIISVINSTGMIQPVKSIPIRPTMAGKVVKVHVAHNAEVKKGQVLAEIDSIPNADYSKIVSEVDGIVLERRIEEGETVSEGQREAAFTIAQDLKKEVVIYASVDEADVGLIRAAQLQKQPVKFTVDAYPESLFQGQIQDTRINPTVQQSVVSYYVVVAAPNAELKLLPGMTAKLSFQIDKRSNVLKIPSAALRFFPKARYVRPEDRRILEGVDEVVQPEGTDQTKDTRSAMQRVSDRRQETRRHVWMPAQGELLRAVQVVTGLNDNTHTELVSGDLQEGQQLVTGVK